YGAVSTFIILDQHWVACPHGRKNRTCADARKAHSGGPLEMGAPPVYRAGESCRNIIDASFALPRFWCHCHLPLMCDLTEGRGHWVPASAHHLLHQDDNSANTCRLALAGGSIEGPTETGLSLATVSQLFASRFITG